MGEYHVSYHSNMFQDIFLFEEKIKHVAKKNRYVHKYVHISQQVKFSEFQA
jgi:hypothetical protein